MVAGFSAELRLSARDSRMKRALSAMRQNRQSEAKRGDDTMPFDLMYRKILSALRADGRLTMSELAEKVGLSQSPCWTRVKRLEARGAIQGYVAVLDHKVIGVPVVVFVEVTLDRHDEGMLEAFGSALVRLHRTLFVWRPCGIG